MTPLGPGKVLSLYPEHVEAFRLGLRTVETRAFQTSYRGRIYLHASLRHPDSAEARRDPISRAVMAAIPHGDPILCGFIRVSAELVDCAPIGGPFDFRTGVVEGDEGDWPGRHVVVVHGDGEVIVDCPDGPNWSLTSEAALGDFRPGRWAWLFNDIQPLAEPVPFKGGVGLTKSWEGPGHG